MAKSIQHDGYWQTFLLVSINQQYIFLGNVHFSTPGKRDIGKASFKSRHTAGLGPTDGNVIFPSHPPGVLHHMMSHRTGKNDDTVYSDQSLPHVWNPLTEHFDAVAEILTFALIRFFQSVQPPKNGNTHKTSLSFGKKTLMNQNPPSYFYLTGKTKYLLLIFIIIKKRKKIDRVSILHEKAGDGFPVNKTCNTSSGLRIFSNPLEKAVFTVAPPPHFRMHATRQTL